MFNVGAKTELRCTIRKMSYRVAKNNMHTIITEPQSSAPPLAGGHSKMISFGEGGRVVRKCPKSRRLLFSQIANSELFLYKNRFYKLSSYNKDKGTSK